MTRTSASPLLGLALLLCWGCTRAETQPQPPPTRVLGHTSILVRAPGHERRIARLGPEAYTRTATPATGLDSIDPLADAARLRRDGEREAAAARLALWLGEAPEHADARLGCTLLGLTLFELVRYADADATLARCEPAPTLADLHSFVHGEVLRGLGRPEEAAERFRQVEAHIRSPLAPAATFRVADALFEAERYRGALKRYDDALEEFPEYPNAPSVRYRSAVCREALGQNRRAAESYAELIRRSPAHDAAIAAHGALADLRARGIRPSQRSFDDELEWAETLRRHRRWPEALALAERIVPHARSKKDKGRLAELTARILESLDRYEEALSQVEAARRHGGWSGDLTTLRIRLLRKLGHTEQAVRLVKARAGSSRRVQALAAAEVYYEDGEYKKAQRLYRRYLRTRYDRDAQWLQAWVDYRAGLYVRARRGFARLVGRSGIREHKAKYWLARAQMKSGLTALAAQTFKQIAEDDPVGYYGIQAGNRLLDLDRPDLYREVTGATEAQLVGPDVRAATGGQIRWAGADGSELPSPPSRLVRADRIAEVARQHGDVFPELWRAHDRFRIGLDDDARRELRIARAEFDRARRGPARLLADRPSSLYVDNRARRRGLWGSSLYRRLGLTRAQKRAEETRLNAIRRTDRDVRGVLTELLATVGDPYYGRRIAYRDHRRALREVPNDQSVDAFKAAYPMMFEPILREEAGQYGVPPFLMTAVARVESAFNELAVSSAGARGLLQVMPVTGRLIAQRRGDWAFSPSQLLNPEVSLSYGTWYMNQLLTKFRGQEPLAIIGYNAGPHRVQQWLARRGAGTELDEFIEEVPYTQARRYVKSVLRYIALYRRIYHGRPDLYVGQVLDPRYLDNINW